MAEGTHQAGPSPAFETGPPSDRLFIRRLLVTLMAIAGAVAVWRLFTVLVLAFASILLALVLRGLAGALGRRTRLPEAGAILVVLLALALGFAGVVWVFGSQIGAQFDLLAKDIPAGIRQLAREVASDPWGAWLLQHAQEVDLTGVIGKALTGVGTVFTAAVRGVTYAAVMLFAAIYLAVQPARYRDGLLRLVPPHRRQRIAAVSDLAGETLQRWVLGQSLTMVIVGVLTGAGLWTLGIGAPLALGLIAGVFAFIPYVGPILAAVPGLLMAAPQGPFLALCALLLYAFVHLVESNLVTPLIQAEIVRLPPLLTVFATLVFGLLIGPVGVFLAGPLTVVLLVALNCLYIEDALGDRRVWPLPSRERIDG
jgi:predicted PurR-regulated permease PerM